MKRKNLALGFTLVELLIVIALIGILSVAVLATIDPIEQANKAKDSAVQNDAAEVLNAYERYYAGQTSYPWVNIGAAATAYTVDSAVYLNSFNVGGGLCTSAAAPTSATDNCSVDPTSHPGILIQSTELKDSFLAKGYAGTVAAVPGYKDMLYVVKRSSDSGNSIFVCYIPKAKANRQNTSHLYDLQITADTYLPTAFTDTNASPATYFDGKYVNTTHNFTTTATSLFKCVP